MFAESLKSMVDIVWFKNELTWIYHNQSPKAYRIFFQIVSENPHITRHVTAPGRRRAYLGTGSTSPSCGAWWPQWQGSPPGCGTTALWEPLIVRFSLYYETCQERMKMDMILQSNQLKALRDVLEDMFLTSKSPHGWSPDLYDVWGSGVRCRYILIPTSTGTCIETNELSTMRRDFLKGWAAASKLSSLNVF